MELTNAPKVSVVIPTYNRAQVLGRAIRSVVVQTFPDWELIVVDDGSADDTEGIVRAFRDPRMRYVRHDRNRGQSAAENTGIAASRGSYVSFLDSDDEWLPRKLASEVALFESAGERIGLVYTGKMLVDEHGRVLKVRIPRAEGRVYQKLLEWDFIGSPSRVSVRKNILAAAGEFDETLRNSQDWDLWVRVAKLTEVGCVRECLVKRHLGSDQHSGSLRGICDGKLRMVEKYRREMPSRVLGKHLGTVAILLGNYDRQGAWQMALEGLKLHWFQPAVFAALAASLLGRGPYRYLFSKWTRRWHSLHIGRAKI
jgi:glycosyltransferase involved in cell wall biosynthesis